MMLKRNLLWFAGGERGIRTLEAACATYTLSKRAPSATQPSLHAFNF